MRALSDRVATAFRDVGSAALVGFLIGSGFVGLVVLFEAGSALTDPGGWRGIGLTAAWLLPLVALSLLALLQPSGSIPVLSVLTLLIATLAPGVLGMLGAGSDWLRELTINVVSAPLVAAGVLNFVAAARRSRTPGTPHHPTSALV